MSYVDKFCRVGEFHSLHHYTALLWIGNCLPSSVRNMQSDVFKYVISACGRASLCRKKQLGNCQTKKSSMHHAPRTQRVHLSNFHVP